jgi:hypothetical protein
MTIGGIVMIVPVSTTTTTSEGSLEIDVAGQGNDGSQDVTETNEHSVRLSLCLST